MMQDPGQSYDELAGRFCRAQYGPAALPMLKCINYLQDREAAADTALYQAKRTGRNKVEAAEELPLSLEHWRRKSAGVPDAARARPKLA